MARAPVSGNKPQPVSRGAKRRAAVVAYSRTLVGIREVPAHSNDGPAVHRIQSSTGAYRLPWCVSTVQYEDKHVLGSTWADRTAGVYYYLEYARRHGCLVAKPLPGDVVAYIIGNGHMGRVVTVHKDGTFDAVEGNHTDGCYLVPRNPRYVPCRFIRRPEYR
jgi:hypothetical protein